MPRGGPRNGAAAQAAAVAFLSDPASYAERPASVEIRETHMSWVFLTERHAYKLKKPVRTGYLDFSSAERRRFFCEEELRLNRRLAPEVYLAVLPLGEVEGGLEIGGAGRTVDWLVQMRRLPAERMLETAIARGTLADSEIAAVADRLAGFYREAPRVDMSGAAYRAQIAAGIAENREALLHYARSIPLARIQALAARQATFLRDRADLFDARARDGRICEGHGDLRPEHVNLGPPPQIIDCLEFERSFRVLDAADDLATLAMDCDRLGEPRVGKALFAAYRRETGDAAPAALIGFCKAYRAMLRAKLAIWHLGDVDVIDPAAWERRAATYLDFAEREWDIESM